MELTQYSEIFAREQISGEIMMELDEEILKTELGITSKLHRLEYVLGNVIEVCWSFPWNFLPN